jgi:hypothetical protein
MLLSDYICTPSAICRDLHSVSNGVGKGWAPLLTVSRLAMYLGQSGWHQGPGCQGPRGGRRPHLRRLGPRQRAAHFQGPTVRGASSYRAGYQARIQHTECSFLTDARR